MIASGLFMQFINRYADRNRTHPERLVADELMKIPGIAYAMTRGDLLAGRITASPVQNQIRRSFHPTRSGNIHMVPEQCIAWRKEPFSASDVEIRSSQVSETPTQRFSPSEKIALFRHLFRGRFDVYPLRWKSAKGKSEISLKISMALSTMISSLMGAFPIYPT